jgi:hypothetical protein
VICALRFILNKKMKRSIYFDTTSPTSLDDQYQLILTQYYPDKTARGTRAELRQIKKDYEWLKQLEKPKLAGKTVTWADEREAKTAK